MQPEGKRSIRRRENAEFTHNPHIVTDVDELWQPRTSLPTHLPPTLLLPPARPPPTIPSTSTAGLFSLSLRGVRRTLRARPFSAHLIGAIETHLATWLQGETYLNPDQAKGLLHFPGQPVGGRQDIREVAREAARLVWAVKPADYPSIGGFERYVVHCVARWYGVVSFSKETDGHRLTYLLRPNITRPDPRVNATCRSLGTPPPTDASDAGLSDFNNITDTSDASDMDSVTGDALTRSLSDIEESRVSSPASWSVLGGPDFAIDSDSNTDDHGFAASMESLSLSIHADDDEADTTLTPSRLQSTTLVTRSAQVEQGGDPTPSRARADRDRLHTLYPRSASSPSPARRSPHRHPPARKLGARRRKVKNDKIALAGATNKGTFYDYLFS